MLIWGCAALQTDQRAQNEVVIKSENYGGPMFVLKPGHDNRLPISGQGTMEWEGIHTFDYNPKVYNPQQDYIVNCNNRPARGVLNPDMFWYSWSKADRVDVLIDMVQSKPKLSASEKCLKSA